MKAKLKPRATRAAIFQRLGRLAGTGADLLIQNVVDLLDGGAASEAITALKAYDDKIGGYCGMPLAPVKPDGVYRPLGYIPLLLQNPHPREMSRYIIDAIGQHVENLLQRVAFLGFLNSTSDRLFPMGKLVRSMWPVLPRQLCEDLQWFAGEVYNHAKHSVEAEARQSPGQNAHYFDLDEALAVYLIGRKLAVQLERWSGKSRDQLTGEY